MRNGEVIYDCPNALCTLPLYTGKCSKECLARYYNTTNSNYAYWEHRAKHNDHLWVECSNCGFRVENYKAVVLDKCDTKFSDVKYKFCPICGKEMRVH